jgi:LysM repeat protein
MNSNQLFSPESSAAELKTQGRARVKVAVYSVLAVHVAGLVALLLTQGCKRETPPEVAQQPDVPAMDTNALPTMDTNMVPAMSTNPIVNDQFPPPVQQLEPVTPAMTKYVIQSGDSFYSIGKAHGVSQKAIEAANPGVDPKKLKLKQEINLPAPGAAPVPTSTSVPAPDVGGPTIYTVKSGDTLSKLATHFGTTTKAIKALNGLATDQIKVNQKLKIPAKATPEPAPVVPTMPAPTTPPATAPAN